LHSDKDTVDQGREKRSLPSIQRESRATASIFRRLGGCHGHDTCHTLSAESHNQRSSFIVFVTGSVYGAPSAVSLPLNSSNEQWLL